MGWTRITVEDLETGEKEAVEIENDYVLVAVGDCFVSHTQVHAGGTHILTVKNSHGRKREVDLRERHNYRPSSDLDGSPCAFCRQRPDEHDDFAPEAA